PGQKRTLRRKEALKERQVVNRTAKLWKPPIFIYQTLGHEISSSGKCVPESDPGLVVDRSG
ncbi:hypothetical protein PIB30_070869, partial [Stylosanthes scabra]|nr:hypothetical protein [Stylosanthes scabra]